MVLHATRDLASLGGPSGECTISNDTLFTCPISKEWSQHQCVVRRFLPRMLPDSQDEFGDDVGVAVPRRSPVSAGRGQSERGRLHLARHSAGTLSLVSRAASPRRPAPASLLHPVRWVWLRSVTAGHSRSRDFAGALVGVEDVVDSARWDLRGGPPARAVPTAIAGAAALTDVRELRCPTG